MNELFGIKGAVRTAIDNIIKGISHENRTSHKSENGKWVYKFTVKPNLIKTIKDNAKEIKNAVQKFYKDKGVKLWSLIDFESLNEDGEITLSIR
jgi:hypothetical protein